MPIHWHCKLVLWQRAQASTHNFDVRVLNNITATAVTDLTTITSDGELRMERLLPKPISAIDKHRADVERAGGRFVPLVVSSTGTWYGNSCEELRRLTSYVACRLGLLENDY